MQQQGTFLALRSYPLSLWEKIRVKGRGSLGAPAMRKQVSRNDYTEGSFLRGQKNIVETLRCWHGRSAGHTLARTGHLPSPPADRGR
jgi:hypothetical protein